MGNYIQRDKHRRKIIAKYELKRIQLKSLIKDFTIPKEVKNLYIEKLNKLPRNSSQIRSRNRCVLTARGRAIFQFCKLSRIVLRNLAGQGILLGVKKSSW